MRGDGLGGHAPVQTGVAMSIMASPLVCCPASRRKPKKKKDGFNTFKGVVSWIMDTGSGVDICGQEFVPADGSGLILPKTKTVFHTANGAVDAGPVYPGKLIPFWRLSPRTSCNRLLLSSRLGNDA